MKPRSLHNLSHFRNTTGHMGQIIPICAAEVLHGDTWKAYSNMFMRLSPLVAPIMHPVHTHVHHYFVPYRTIWEDFENFITGGEDFNDASVVPTIDFSGSPVTKGSLADHLGIPVGYNGTVEALRFRAFAKIYNEIYRDDQLQSEVGLDITGGADTTTNTAMLRCNWNKDYFVGARPDDLLGDDVTLALGTTAPVVSTDEQIKLKALTGSNFTDGDLAWTNATASRLYPENPGTASAGAPVGFGTVTGLQADLASAAGLSINALRVAIATQQWQEIINHTGNTYPDYLRRYGIKYSDARLQRAEYLGGGKQTVQFSEVLQTAEGADGDVGAMRGHGIAAMRSNNYIKFFEEPGVVISVLIVKPIRMYMQGIHRTLTRTTKEEFYQKEYEILGMQDVKNKEIYFEHATPNGTFGYSPRFDEFRSIPNTVHGDFTDYYKSWTMVEDFGSDPALNSTFITCNPSNRIFQDQTNPPLIINVQNKIAARRFVPKFHKPSGLSI